VYVSAKHRRKAQLSGDMHGDPAAKSRVFQRPDIRLRLL
jgi:hypothetical protein